MLNLIALGTGVWVHFLSLTPRFLPLTLIVETKYALYCIMHMSESKRGRRFKMKVSLDVSPEFKEPYAVIHTDRVTEEIQRILEVFGTTETPVTAFRNEEDIVILKPVEIFMVRVENGDTIIYGEKQQYRSKKRLYELSRQLGNRFMQISKSTIINLSCMDSIEASFGCSYLLKLKNGCSDYVTRTYLPAFKKYLGL